MEVPELSLAPTQLVKTDNLIISSSASPKQETCNSSRKRKLLLHDHHQLKPQTPAAIQTSVDLHLKDPLPFDWEQCLDLQSGKMYYLNRKTLRKSWNWPREEEEADDDEEEEDDDRHHKLDLELELNNLHSSSSSTSSFSSSSAAAGGGGGRRGHESFRSHGHGGCSTMVALPCLNCHLLVILSKSSPACPNCKHLHSLFPTPPPPKTPLNTLPLLN